MRPAGCAHPFCDGTEKGAGSASRFDNSQFVKRTVRRITHQIEDEFDHPAASEDLSVFRCVIDIEPTMKRRGQKCYLLRPIVDSGPQLPAVPHCGSLSSCLMHAVDPAFVPR